MDYWEMDDFHNLKYIILRYDRRFFRNLFCHFMLILDTSSGLLDDKDIFIWKNMYSYVTKSRSDIFNFKNTLRNKQRKRSCLDAKFSKSKSWECNEIIFVIDHTNYVGYNFRIHIAHHYFVNVLLKIFFSFFFSLT